MVVAGVMTMLLISAVVLGGRSVAVTKSGTWDETVYMFLGRELLVSNNWEQFAHLGVAPLPVRLAWDRNALTPLDVPVNDETVYRDRVDRARQNAVWRAGVPLVLGVFVWIGVGHGLFAGFVAAALLALSPNVLAHASLATTDVPFAATFVASVVALVLYLQKQSWGRAAALALALGVALATKYSALVLFLAVAVLFILQRRGRRWLPDLLTIVGALFVTWAAHGWAVAPLIVEGGAVSEWVTRLFGWTGESARLSGWLGALPVPMYVRGIAAQLYLDRSGQEAFLLGQTALQGWWYYFPVALALKSTPVELIAFPAFAVLAVVRRGRPVETQVLATVAIVFAAVAIGSHRALGIRYVLPLIVLCVAGAVAWLADALRGRPRLAAGLAATALTAQLVSCVTIAPDFLAYFNRLSGGPANGYTKLVDSNLDWGQDLPRLADWLRERGTNRVTLAYFGSAPPLAYGIRADTLRTVVPEGEPGPPWFAISVTLLQGVFVCDDPFAPLRAIAPAARIGYTMMVYSTADSAVEGALNAARRDPCLP